MTRFDSVDSLRPALRTMPEYQALEDIDQVAARSAFWSLSPYHSGW